MTIDEPVPSRPRHITFPGHGGETAHAWYYAPRNDAVARRPRAQATAPAARARRTDVVDDFALDPSGAVLDQPRLRIPRRRLRRQHRLRPRVPRSAQRAVGRRRCRRLPCGRAASRRHRRRRSRPPVHSRRERRRIRGAVRDDVPRPLPGGCKPLRHRRPGSAVRDARDTSSRRATTRRCPKGRGMYDRSPVHFIDQVRGAVLLLQGLDDPVVPAEQAELMFAALKGARSAVCVHRFSGRAARVP